MKHNFLLKLQLQFLLLQSVFIEPIASQLLNGNDFEPTAKNFDSALFKRELTPIFEKKETELDKIYGVSLGGWLLLVRII